MVKPCSNRHGSAARSRSRRSSASCRRAGRTELADGLAAFQRAAEPDGLTGTDMGTGTGMGTDAGMDAGTDGSQGPGIPFSISA